MDGSEQQIAATERPRKRGRGKPFVLGDSRINRAGVPSESVALAKLLREVAADVLFSPSPDDPAKTQLTCIVEALVDKAKQGDVRAAEVLFERVGGRPTQPEADASDRGRITIEWDGPPPPWAPKHVLENYRRKNALPAADTQTIEAEALPPA